jgi:hypothetical protein
MKVTGKCLCGQVRYSVGGEALMTAVCHCRNCQRQAGSAFSVIMAVPTDAFTIDGETRTYIDTADSGTIVHRTFCPRCGSPLISVLPDAPQITYIKAGTLDDVGGLDPQIEIWCKSAQPWLDAGGRRLRFVGNPPAG